MVGYPNSGYRGAAGSQKPAPRPPPSRRPPPQWKRPPARPPWRSPPARLPPTPTPRIRFPFRPSVPTPWSVVFGDPWDWLRPRQPDQPATIPSSWQLKCSTSTQVAPYNCGTGFTWLSGNTNETYCGLTGQGMYPGAKQTLGELASVLPATGAITVIQMGWRNIISPCNWEPLYLRGRDEMIWWRLPGDTSIPQPVPGAEPVPSIPTLPSPPRVTPTPAPIINPESPTPGRGPQPRPNPRPKPQVPVPVPSPNPRPRPRPRPRPSPRPNPSPSPEPSPRPYPEPTPNPEPVPRPDPKPVPVPRPVPRPVPAPEVVPVPAPPPETGLVPIVVQEPFQPPKVGTQPLPRPERKPKPREKEKKVYIGGKAASIFQPVIGRVTETMEFIDAFYKGVPWCLRPNGNVNPAKRLETIYNEWDYIRWNKVLEELVANQVEDWTIGQVMQRANARMEDMDQTFGYETLMGNLLSSNAGSVNPDGLSSYTDPGDALTRAAFRQFWRRLIEEHAPDPLPVPKERCRAKKQDIYARAARKRRGRAA